MGETKVKKELKSQKAITLVALIITIIALLILAGITIGTLTADNGVIKKATEAQILTELSSVEEALEIYKIKEHNDGDMSNEELVEEGLLKEVFINDTYRTVGIITNLEKIEVNGKLGKNGEKQEETEVHTILDLYDVYGIDMIDGTLYYIRDGIWSIEGKKVTYTASTGEDKEGYVVETINEQYIEDRKFITEWTVEAGTTITLPITSAPDATIEWGADDDGDGELDKEQCTTVQPTHTYTEAGAYIVKVSGKMTNWKFGAADTSKDYITGIKQWGNTGLTGIDFKNCSNLEGTIPSHKTSGEFANLSNADYMFYSCSKLTGNIPEDLFESATKIATFYNTFYECTGLTGEIPAKLFEDNIEVGSFSRCFWKCSGITGKIPEGLFKNCSKAQEFTLVFSNTSIDEIPPNLFDINNGQENGILRMAGTFEKTKITKIPSGLFDLCTEVTDFGAVGVYGGLFQGCEELEEVPENIFAKNTKVKKFGSCFSGCIKLKTIPSKLFYYNTQVTDFYQVFNNCVELEEIPENTFNITSECYMLGAFRGCKNLKKVTNEVFAVKPTFNNMGWLFDGCTSLEEIGDYFRISEGVTSIEAIFSGCTNLSSIPENFVIPESVNNIKGAFYKCQSLNSTIILKTNEVTYSSSDFFGVNESFRVNWASPCTEEKVDEILAVTGGSEIKGIEVTE